jgi:hypothetical protein
MEISGKIIQVLALETGSGKNGQWKKQSFILETAGTYPKKVNIALWGDKIDQSPLDQGTDVKVQFDVESREYNGRWYTECKAWKVERADAAGAGSAPSFNQGGSNTFPPANNNYENFSDEDKLPF